MHRRSFARGVPLSGNRSFLAAWSDLWIRQRSWAFALRSFHHAPSAPTHVSMSACPTCRFPRIHLDDLVEGSAAKFYRSLRDRTPLHPRESQEATVDRGCADRLLGFTNGQAVHHQGCRDLSPDFVLPAVPILPWAWPLSGFADTFPCARAGTTPIEPSASAASDRHRAFAAGRILLAIRSWAWRWAFSSRSEMHGPDVCQ
jgi:hypothetical protein